MPGRRVVAAFDFDETLIRRNTLPDFLLRWESPWTALVKMARFSPDLVRFGFGRITNSEAKERLLRLFIGGLAESDWNRRCARYADRLDRLADQSALRRVAWHAQQGHEVVIVSASAEDWIRPWAQRHNISKVIATRLERKGGRLTGKLNGANCHGAQKVVRFLECYPRRETYELYMYGDGKSDQQMFELADHVFKQRFS